MVRMTLEEETAKTRSQYELMWGYFKNGGSKGKSYIMSPLRPPEINIINGILE